MTQTPDPSISILARLKNVGRTAGYPADLLLLYYVQEGVMARLSRSAYVAQFVLKGGLSLYARYQTAARPTVDVDLGARALPNTLEALRACWSEILAVPWSDHLHFEIAEMQLERILEGAEHEGVRISVTARLGRSRQRLQLDVSFGNVITPGPVTVEFPTLLSTETHPVLSYPLESVVAEKFAALVQLGRLNTRMKDFYDLYRIAQDGGLEPATLRSALERTCRARDIPLEAARSILSEDFVRDAGLQQRWDQFLRRTTLAAPPQLEAVLRTVGAFLEPALQGPGEP